VSNVLVAAWAESSKAELGDATEVIGSVVVASWQAYPPVLSSRNCVSIIRIANTNRAQHTPDRRRSLSNPMLPAGLPQVARPPTSVDDLPIRYYAFEFVSSF
jgi:hypothetical protein